jgi:hypothetical protein
MSKTAQLGSATLGEDTLGELGDIVCIAEESMGLTDIPIMRAKSVRLLVETIGSQNLSYGRPRGLGRAPACARMREPAPANFLGARAPMRTSSPIIPTFRPREHETDQIHAQNRHSFTFRIILVSILQIQRETADYATWFHAGKPFDNVSLPCDML